MTDLIFALKWFLSSTIAYVAGNLFIYYEEGNPRAVVAPDVFVIMGVPQRRRRIFQTWKEGGRVPDVVIEITSKRTQKDDRERKPVSGCQHRTKKCWRGVQRKQRVRLPNASCSQKRKRAWRRRRMPQNWKPAPQNWRRKLPVCALHWRSARNRQPNHRRQRRRSHANL